MGALRRSLGRLARRLGLRKVSPDTYLPPPLLDPFPSVSSVDSVDGHPWQHPFLTADNIGRFRRYSEVIWQAAADRDRGAPLDIGLTVNMAQTAYLWAKMGRSLGATTTVYLHAGDSTALSRPEWEEFDGEYPDVMDGPGFLSAHSVPVAVPVETVLLTNDGLSADAYHFRNGRRGPLLRRLAAAPGLRPEPFLAVSGIDTYFKWAAALTRHDVLVGSSLPIPAYLSGRPYCAFVVGGDLQIDCGRGGPYGAAMSLAFAAARFILLSNPHTLGHCRRLGLTNALYLPYPINEDNYCPGPGRARAEWQSRFGGKTFLLSTARIDKAVKGNSAELWQALTDVCRDRPDMRFVFLAWGHTADELRTAVGGNPVLKDKFIFLPPVGKKRLIDYYRSCDAVIDQFVYGYYGATALEAAAIGKPVVMRIRPEHYAPLYAGDVAPVCNAATPAEVAKAVALLADQPDLRAEQGRRMRDWLVRNHGKEVAGRRLLAVLRLTADGAATPPGLDNPLLDVESEAEVRYHNACRQVRAGASPG